MERVPLWDRMLEMWEEEEEKTEEQQEAERREAERRGAEEQEAPFKRKRFPFQTRPPR